MESSGQDTYIDAPGEVAKYQRMWTDIVERALDPDRSRAFIAGMLTG